MSGKAALVQLQVAVLDRDELLVMAAVALAAGGRPCHLLPDLPRLRLSFNLMPKPRLKLKLTLVRTANHQGPQLGRVAAAPFSLMIMMRRRLHPHPHTQLRRQPYRCRLQCSSWRRRLGRSRCSFRSRRCTWRSCALLSCG